MIHPSLNSAPMLTIATVAQQTAVSTKTVRRWIKTGELRSHRLGRSLRISQHDLSTFIALRRG